MLSREALQAAYPLTEAFDASSTLVVPVPDSALAHLVSATRSDNLTMLAATDGELSCDVDFIATMANMADDKTGVNFHHSAMADFVPTAANAVKEHIRFARAVVAPLVDDLVTRVSGNLSKLTPSVLAGAEICADEPPAPLLNSALDGMVGKFLDTAIFEPPLRMNLPDQTLAQLRELMLTGSGSFDNDINLWLSTGDSWLIELWESVFQQKPHEGLVERNSFGRWVEDKACGVDHALAIFLLARKLFDKPLDGTEMSLRIFEELVANFRDQAAGRLARELDAIERRNKNGVLVTGFNRLKTSVNPDVYRQWIEAGGCNEVLFGNALQQFPYVLTDEINANAEKLTKAWSDHCLVMATHDKTDRFNRTKDYLLMAFRDQIADAMQEPETSLSNGAQLVDKFREALETVSDKDLECLYTLALKLICSVRFPEKAAFEILSGIQSNQTLNPNLEVREAAFAAIYEYILCFVGSMMRPVKA